MPIPKTATKLSHPIRLPQLYKPEGVPFTPKIPERMRWSASSIKTFRTCRRMFFWKYIMGLESRYSAGSLLIGTAFHECLGDWYKGQNASMVKIAERHHVALTKKFQDGVVGEAYSVDDVEKYEVQINTFRGTMLGYATWYAHDREDYHFDPDLVEVEFSVPFEEFDFSGKIDAIPRNSKGQHFVMEHKSASRLSTAYSDRLVLDTQNRGYLVGATMGLGLKPIYVLYDAVGKCKLRKKGGEDVNTFSARICDAYMSDPTKYFYREPLTYGKAAIDALIYELHQTHKEYQAIVRGDFGNPLDPRSWNQNDKSCNDYFQICKYLPLETIGLDRGTSIMYSERNTDAAVDEEA